MNFVVLGTRTIPAVLVLAAISWAATFPSSSAGSHGRVKLLAMTDEVRGMCTQSEQLINAQRFADAIKLLQRAGSIDPSCAEVHGYLGLAYQNSGNPRHAIEEYQEALKLGAQQMSFINVNIGNCFLNLDQPQQAVPYFQQYLRENPGAPDAAQVQQSIQNAGGRKNQLDLRSVVEQGQSLLNSHRFSEAQSAFQQAITMQPNFAPAHFYLGYALAQSGSPQPAIAEFQAALQLDPAMKEAIINIASNYQTTGDINSAISWYERYLQENPGSPKCGEIRNRITGLRQQAKSMPAGASASPAASDYLANVTAGGKYFRWPPERMPIRVFIAQGDPASGFRNSFGQDLSNALDAWSQATEMRVGFALVTDPTQADIYCDWTSDPNRVEQSGKAVEGGLTKLTAQQTNSGPDVQITRARMTILTTGGGGVPRSDDEMKKVCLHEIGHAIGLNGHSSNNQDIMFFTETPSGWPVLSARDKSTICRLYANYPQMRNCR